MIDILAALPPNVVLLFAGIGLVVSAWAASYATVCAADAAYLRLRRRATRTTAERTTP